MARFERKYLDEDERNKSRDRFQVEFNDQERREFQDMQKALRQSKDATALKQWAWLGWVAYSNISGYAPLLRDTLLKNESNNRRIGVVPEVEIERKIHT